MQATTDNKRSTIQGRRLIFLTILLSALVHVLLLAALGRLYPAHGERPIEQSQIQLFLPQPATSPSSNTVPNENLDTTASAIPNVPALQPEASSIPQDHPNLAGTTPSPEPDSTAPEILTVTTSGESSALSPDLYPDNRAAKTDTALYRLNNRLQTVTHLTPSRRLIRLMDDGERNILREALTQLTEDPPALLLSTADPQTIAHNGREYQISARPVDTGSNTDLPAIEINIRTEENGREWHNTAVIQRQAFSSYAKLIDRWDADVMLANDRVDGRFHANSQLSFTTDRRARPEFNGLVTIAASQSLSRRLRQSGMFSAGVKTSVERIPLPSSIKPLITAPDDHSYRVYYFDDDVSIRFLNDGGFEWTALEDEEHHGQIAAGENELYILGRDGTRFEVSGEIAAPVLVYSPRRITITGNLVYARASSFLGLLSDGSIEIASRAITGPGDLKIHGALFARQRFSVRRFRDRSQGELYIFGSLIAGSISATEPRYTTYIEFDPRLSSKRPPLFPLTSAYRLSQWKTAWQSFETTYETHSEALPFDFRQTLPAALP